MHRSLQKWKTLSYSDLISSTNSIACYDDVLMCLLDGYEMNVYANTMRYSLTIIHERLENEGTRVGMLRQIYLLEAAGHVRANMNK